VLSTTAPALFLDYFRAPHRVEEARGATVRVVGDDSGRALSWPAAVPTTPRRHRLDGITFFARVADDAFARTLLGVGWDPVAEVASDEGETVAHVWRDGDGNVFVPFDPDEAIRAYWSEAYRMRGSTSTPRTALRAYYRVRPLLPRRVQIAARRAFSRVQARTAFPRWPVETSLHDLYRWLYAALDDACGAPVPGIAPWPDEKAWAFVLTHDVELDVGCRSVHLLRDIEERHGLRSSWNFVPRRYETPQSTIGDLHDRGFEVGVHGLYHDGRDLESRAMLEERLPAMRAAAKEWSAVGFRSPATHRDWDLMPLLGFDYDSSYPDTDPFEPQGGGCCSWWPFFNRDLVELPITLPQDHTLLVILRRGADAWAEKARALRARGGMALTITHPDYMLDDERLEMYDAFVSEFADDPTAWHALPREVSAWWRRRAESTLVRDGDGWRVDGPAAAEGRVATASEL
jgi:hypothetical protein